MKKLLSILGAVTVITIEASGVVGCGGEKEKTIKQPETQTEPKTKILQKATDQQFADEIANIINKKKEIFLSFEEATIKEKLKNKIKKDFIKEKIEIKNADTTEFDKTKIDIRLNWNMSEIRNTIIVYNNTLSTIKVNLKIIRV